METDIERLIPDILADMGGGDLIRDANGGQGRADVLRRAACIADGLTDLELEAGARVAVYCDSPANGVTGFIGLLQSPFCAVPIHNQAPELAVAHIVSDCLIMAVVSDLPASRLPQSLRELPLIDATKASMPDRTEHICHDRKDDDIAVLLYTSGTTGTPKGGKISVGNLHATSDILTHDFFRVGAGDTMLMAAPLNNIFGISLVVTALRAKATLSILEEMTPAVLGETLVRDRVTFIAGVPMLAKLMLRIFVDQPDPLPDLKRVLLAGTTLSPELAEAFGGKFGAEVMTGYAMTEAVPIAMALDTKDREFGAVGHVARGIDLRIVDEALNDLPVGQAGEILIRGPQVSNGYWNADEINAAAFVDGWFRTGDVGQLDAKGDLMLVDRLKDIIKTAGNTVYPSEVETVLRAHPAVQDVAVTGEHHQTLGEVVVAHFVPNQGVRITTSELRAWCKDRLMSYKLPRKFAQHESFPMTASGKIAKIRLG